MITTEQGISTATESRGALAAFKRLREAGHVEIRLHKIILYTGIYRADDQLLVSQQVSGVPASEAPVLHLRLSEGDAMFSAYLASLAHVWSSARTPD